MNATIGRLTDSTSGTASATTIVALTNGSTWATDIAALRNNLATLTATFNQLIAAVSALQSKGTPR